MKMGNVNIVFSSKKNITLFVVVKKNGFIKFKNEIVGVD